jgi:hypothetical protein
MQLNLNRNTVPHLLPEYGKMIRANGAQNDNNNQKGFALRSNHGRSRFTR